MAGALFGEPLAIVAVLAGNIALAAWLGSNAPGLRLLGPTLLVILLTALTANIGLIPSVTAGSPVYDGIFRYIGPLAIFWLLLGVELRHVLAAGLPMLALFALGATGTLLGVLVAMALVDGRAAFGEYYAALGGMFTGTYVGGSLNFNAVALEFGVQREGLLFAGAGVVDNLMTTVWMVVTLAAPRLVASWWPRGRAWPAAAAGRPAVPAASPLPRDGRAPPAADGATLSAPAPAEDRRAAATDPAMHDEETLAPGDLGILIALGAGAVWLSRALAATFGDRGIQVPEILILTTIALGLAQVPWVNRLRGTRLAGMFAVLLFLAAIGALCDVSELAKTGALGLSLSAFVVLVVLTHGLVVFGGARALRFDPTLAAVASQANVGGGTSALALARSLGRPDLVAPALLLGSLGNAVGTYLGFFAASLLGG